jgi:hypothetical protein
MKEITCAVLTVSVLLLGALPADAWGGVRVAGRGPTVVVAPQQTFILPNHQAVIVAEPFPVVQRPFFIPGGVWCRWPSSRSGRSTIASVT